jgi:hypothetical protein
MTMQPIATAEIVIESVERIEKRIEIRYRVLRRSQRKAGLGEPSCI